MSILRIKLILIFVASALVYGCGYKLGGLEVIGNNSNKTAAIKIDATKSQIQSFINSGFIINNDKFDLMVVIDGPNYKKETSSVTSSAPDTSPSVINFKFTFNFFSSSMCSLCLGLSSKHAVIFSGFLFR